MFVTALFGPVQEDLERVEALLEGVIAEVEYPLLAQVLGQVLRRRGKRLRPALALLAAHFFDYQPERVLPLAGAVELLHTATLIHDDLIDNAPTRRGLPALHALVGPKATILVGDYLFARSAAMASATESVRVMALFARALMQICDSELRQVFRGPVGPESREEYYRRIYGKTAALFVTATEGGAVLSHAPEPAVQALAAYGANLGLAFQIVDDVLDFIGDERELGKPVGSDLRQGTVTLPVLWFLERYPEEPLLHRVIAGDDLTDGAVRAAVALIADSPAIGYALEEARQLAQQAKAALDILPDNPYRRALWEIADYAVERRS